MRPAPPEPEPCVGAGCDLLHRSRSRRRGRCDLLHRSRSRRRGRCDLLHRPEPEPSEGAGATCSTGAGAVVGAGATCSAGAGAAAGVGAVGALTGSGAVGAGAVGSGVVVLVGGVKSLTSCSPLKSRRSIGVCGVTTVSLRFRESGERPDFSRQSALGRSASRTALRPRQTLLAQRAVPRNSAVGLLGWGSGKLADRRLGRRQGVANGPGVGPNSR